MTRKNHFIVADHIITRYGKSKELPFDRLSCFMDIFYSKVDVGKLYNADDATFFHDVDGIFANFNRETHSLDNCFVPRSGFGEYQ